VCVQAAAPSQASARHARVNGAIAVHASQPLQTGQPKVSQQLAPVQPSKHSGQQQPAQQICEAYDLETFLKERDACGVGFVAARYNVLLTFIWTSYLLHLL